MKKKNLKKKQNKLNLESIISLIFCLLGIVLVITVIALNIIADSKEPGAGAGIVYSTIFALMPVGYYFAMFKVFSGEDGKTLKPIIKHLLLWGPLLVIMIMIGSDKLINSMEEKTNQSYKNVSITIPEDFKLGLYMDSYSKRDATYVSKEDVYCRITFIGHSKDDDFLDDFYDVTRNEVLESNLIDVDVNGKTWSYFVSNDGYEQGYGYMDDNYHYYLMVATNEQDKEYCYSKFQDVIDSVKYK